MKFPKKFRINILFLLLFPSIGIAESLSIKQAEQLALYNDQLALSFASKAEAFVDESVAAGTWPDPRLVFGVQALPTDSFDLDQEPMTQIVLGYQQMLPRGDSNRVKAEAMQAMASTKRGQQELRKRQVIKQVRKAWLQVYLQEQSQKIIQKNWRLFNQQLKISRSLYAAGKGKQQDVLQAELDISLLDDRLENIVTQKQEARAQLAKWIGVEAANLPLALNDQLLPSIDSSELPILQKLIDSHPEITTRQALVENAKAEVNLAKEKYSSQWGFNVAYGIRDGENMDGSDRADFFTALVNVDLPIFTENKQDRQLSSKKKQLLAARYEKQDTIISLQSQFDQMYTRWKQLKKRLQLYDHDVLTRARQNAKAALNGYQSGVVSFLTLTRARSAELKAELQRLQLNVQKAMTLADIYFLVGEAE